MKNLATIQKIFNFRPIEGKDRIIMAQVLGWQCIVKKDEFKENDLCVFIVPDTILPFNPWNEFLKDKNNPEKPIRLKTIKMGGKISQGLCLPVTTLTPYFALKANPTITIYEGLDVTETLGITHYVKPIPTSLSGVAKGDFPTHLVPKTDELNILSYPKAVEELKGKPYAITMKMDGCLDENSMVDTENGKISIKELCEIKEKPKILSYDIFSEKEEFDSVINTSILEDNSDWYELILEDGTVLKVTGNHPIWLEDKKCYREVKNLQKGDVILQRK